METVRVDMSKRFDDDLRIKFKGKINFDFESFENCLPDSPDLLESMKKDCTIANNRKDDAVDTTTVGESDYAAEGCTYFQKANEPARCWLEELALCIFHRHTKNAEYDPAISGAEWWTMVVNSESDIGFHWDRDYGLEGASGYNVHPHLGTVTYLTANGGPTVVLNKRGELLSEDDHTGEADELIVSRPKVGKHIKFDGRMLHAAPADLLPSDPAMRGVKRVTFLVNIWLNNIPLQTRKYPEAALGEFCSPPVMAMTTRMILQKWGRESAGSGMTTAATVGGAASGSGVVAGFDLAAVLKAKRQKFGACTTTTTTTATTLFGGKGKFGGVLNPVFEGNSKSRGGTMPGTGGTVSGMPVPELSMASQLTIRTKLRGPPFQTKEWNFNNGGWCCVVFCIGLVICQL